MVLLYGHVTTPQATGQMSGQCVELALNVGSIRSYAWRGVRRVEWVGVNGADHAPMQLSDGQDSVNTRPPLDFETQAVSCDNES
jgi:hypothetical protein